VSLTPGVRLAAIGILVTSLLCASPNLPSDCGGGVCCDAAKPFYRAQTTLCCAIHPEAHGLGVTGTGTVRADGWGSSTLSGKAPGATPTWWGRDG
jgi:hypothetical protein